MTAAVPMAMDGVSAPIAIPCIHAITMNDVNMTQ
jgi:hypothetical protein